MNSSGQGNVIFDSASNASPALSPKRGAGSGSLSAKTFLYRDSSNVQNVYHYMVDFQDEEMLQAIEKAKKFSEVQFSYVRRWSESDICDGVMSSCDYDTSDCESEDNRIDRLNSLVQRRPSA